MRKLLLALILCGLMAPAFAQWQDSKPGTQWQDPYPGTQTIQQPEDQPEAPSEVQKGSVVPVKRHNISIEYGILNFTDLATIVASAVADMFGETDDHTSIWGDIGINYGYEVNNAFETGVVFNVALLTGNTTFLTFMPRAKINFNKGGFFNPYMEADAGVLMGFDSSDFGAIFMAHGTLLGLEIGKFYMQLLGWGQRGLFYAGFKQSF